MNELRFCYFLNYQTRRDAAPLLPLSYEITATICAVNGVITAPNDDLNQVPFAVVGKNGVAPNSESFREQAFDLSRGITLLTSASWS